MVPKGYAPASLNIDSHEESYNEVSFCPLGFLEAARNPGFGILAMRETSFALILTSAAHRPGLGGAGKDHSVPLPR